MTVRSTKSQMWMGPRDYERWVPAPKTNADFSSIGTREEDQYLGGGAGVRGSKDGHKVYNMSWSSKRREELASVLNIASGDYDEGDGDDLVYFIDPTVYDWNVLPKMLASPYKTGLDGVPLATDLNGYPVFPTLEPSPRNARGYPARSAAYHLDSAATLTEYAWIGSPNASTSIRRTNGVVDMTQYATNPKLSSGSAGWKAITNIGTGGIVSRGTNVNAPYPFRNYMRVQLGTSPSAQPNPGIAYREDAPFIGGTAYTFSIYGQVGKAGGVSGATALMAARLIWFDSLGVEIGSRSYASTRATGGNWNERFVITALAPAGATTYELTFYGGNGAAAWTAGDIFYATAVNVTPTGVAVPYLDGDKPDTGELPTLPASPLYVPIPPGKTLWLGVHGAEAGATLAVTPYNGPAALETVYPEMLDADTDQRVNTSWSRADGVTGVEIGLALMPGNSTGDVTLQGVIAQILDDDAQPFPGDFIAGEGNSGCEFAGIPTLSPYLGGKMWGMNAKLTEVGSWR